MTGIPYILLPDEAISLVVDHRPHLIPRTHPNFRRIREALRTGRHDQVAALVDLPAQLAAYGGGRVAVEGGVVTLDGRPVHHVLADRILRQWREGFPVEPLARFLENLLENPSRTAVQELYLWLERSGMPITRDGCFLAYKKVRHDLRSYHPPHPRHAPGTVVEMPRNEVDDCRERTCSTGLHFCSASYLPRYHGTEGVVLILKVNPRDVVSIPLGDGDAKGRACRYEVLGRYDYDWSAERQMIEEPPVYLEPEGEEGEEGEGEARYVVAERFRFRQGLVRWVYDLHQGRVVQAQAHGPDGWRDVPDTAPLDAHLDALAIDLDPGGIFGTVRTDVPPAWLKD